MSRLELKLSGADNFFLQEAYRFLRTNIQFCGSDIQTIAVTSCYENEGKTTVSLNIARVFAELGKKVLLIDADMRKSVIAGRNLNTKSYTGLSELLTGIVKDVGSCLQQTNIDNMYVMIAGVYPPNPTELLSTKYFEAMLQALRNHFDYIIIDTPPLGAVTDAAIIAPKCDGTLLVIGNDKIKRSQAQNVVAQLKSGGANILGAIRNNCLKKGSGAYYRKSYYKKRSYKS